MKFHQHIPTFVEGVEPKTVEFSSVEELVVKVKELGYLGEKCPVLMRHEDYLMEVSEDNTYGWVIGQVDGVLDLPVWESK